MIVAILGWALDRVSKYWIMFHLTLGEQVTVVPGILSFWSTRNTGAAFGILQQAQPLFITIATLISMALLYAAWHWRHARPLLRIALGLLLAGAVGNFVDRVLWGEVVDFIAVQFVRFPVFNIADTCVTIGAILLFLSALQNDRLSEQKASSSSMPEQAREDTPQ
ncbi:MAG: signal peptidase II [Firmicutes bacterium]|nr:signal peptidase II [Bacillota bacterium]